MKTYKDSGVDIEAGDETIRRIKPLVKSTFNKNVLADIGLFGGFYEANFPEYEHPVLVASTDGVGTKLKIAFMTGVHDTVGQCLVNHGVNDILSCGAKPLFFLDYFATGKLEPTVAEQVISGFVKACGETAEMPSMYQEGEYDVSGTIIGVVEKSKIVNGKNIIPGDVLIGLPSTGLHTNGYSLARAVLLEKYPVTQYFDELGCTLGEALLKVHHSYLHVVTPLLETGFIKGISHITGGGIIGNTKRILPEGTSLNIDWNSWETLPIFKLIQKEGNISDEEMRLTFNLGIGMLLVVDKSNVAQILSLCEKEKPVLIGRIKN